jgi:hypothetical protein
MAFKAVYINSVNRDVSTIPEDFTITDTSDMYNIPPKSVKLTYASIPYTWYNIISSNNTFTLYEVPSGNFPLTIAPGNYGGAELATAVQTALNTSGGLNTYTVTFNCQAMTFTITSTGVFTLGFNSTGSIAVRLGFAPGTIQPTGTSLTSTQTARLLADTEIFICSDLVGGIDNGFSKLQPGVATNTQILAVVPITGCFGSIISFIAPIDNPFFSTTQSNYAQPSPPNGERIVRFFLQFPSQFPLSLNGYNWSNTLVFNFTSS